MNLQNALLHLRRVRHQFGEPLILHSKKYRVRGYHANRLATDPRHEPYMTSVLRRALEGRSGAFLDVGTNVGQTFTKILSIDPSRRYIGFDPQLSCCFFLERFICDNNIENASVMPIALSNENGTLALYSSEDYDEMASIEGNIDSTGGERSRRTYVPTRIGDEIMAEIGVTEVAAIKVDVEGAELPVLQGLRGTLAKHKPALVFEVLPNFYGIGKRQMLNAKLSEKNRSRANAIYAFLTSFGYEISQVGDSDGAFHHIERFELDDPSPSYRGNNYIAFAR